MNILCALALTQHLVIYYRMVGVYKDRRREMRTELFLSHYVVLEQNLLAVTFKSLNTSV